MFGIAVFAALIKLWSPDVSSPASFAAEAQTNSETPWISNQARTLNIETRKPLKLEPTGQNREQYIRPTLDIPDPKESSVREPPVFFRPSTEGSGGNTATESGPVCGDLGDFPRSSRIVFPLQDDYFYSYDDTWGAPRPQGGHEGTDMMTPSGVPEYAITDGTVVPVSGSNGEGWNSLGGYTVMVRADHDIGPVREGDLFYYAHMDEKSTLPVGAKVRAGQVIGYSGDTGQGPEVTRGLFPPHLHLGWYDGGGDRSDLESGAMNPYPLLEWLKRNGGSVVGGSGAEYCEAPRNEETPPAQMKRRPFPNSPGKSPDLDTGTKDSHPSPLVTERSAASRTETVRGGKDKASRADASREKSKNRRARSVETKNAEKTSSSDRRRTPIPRDNQRHTGQPDSPVRHRAPVPVDQPSKEPEKPNEDRTATAPTMRETREKENVRRGTETSPEKTKNDDPIEPEKERSEDSSKPEPPGENECDATECPTGLDEPESTVQKDTEETDSRESTPEEQGGTIDGGATTASP